MLDQPEGRFYQLSMDQVLSIPMKQALRLLMFTLAVILTVSSLSLLAFRYQLLNADMYERALSRSGIYTSVTSIVVTKTTAYLTGLQKQYVASVATDRHQNGSATQFAPVIVWALNSVIEDGTSKIVNQVADTVSFTSILQRGTRRVIHTSTAWLADKQPDPPLLGYLPDKQEVESMKKEGVVPYIVNNVREQSGLANLPPCASPQDVANNLKLITQGKASQLTCYSPSIRSAINSGAAAVRPAVQDSQLADSVNGFLAQYQLKPLAEDLYNSLLTLSVYRQNIYTLKSYVQQSRTWALWALLGSFICLAIGLLLSKGKERMRSALSVYAVSGATMAVGASAYMLVATQYVQTHIPITFARLSDPAITFAQRQEFRESVVTAASMIARDAGMLVFIIGFIMLMLAVAGFSSLKVYSDPEAVASLGDRPSSVSLKKKGKK